MANSQPTEDSLGGLEKAINVDGMIVGSDYHGNYDLIKSGMKYANDNNLMYVVNGDIVNDYSFQKLYADMGYKAPSEIQMEYLSDNLSKQDLEALMLYQNVAQYGKDALLSNVPESNRKQAESQLDEIMKYAQSELFQSRIKKVTESFVNEKGQEIQDSALKLRALYDVFMDEEARRFAEVANEYGGIIGFNGGNHENAYFVDMVKQYMDNPDNIIDLNKEKSPLKLQNSSGEYLKIGAMTNCAQFMPYLNEIFSPEELGMLYSHTYEEKHMEDLDVFISHGQIGKPMGINNARDVPYLDSAKQNSLEAKLTVEGHIHNKFDGENSYGRPMVRAAGEEAVVIYKEDGDVKKEWVKLGEGYEGGHHNPIPYDLDYLSMRVDDMLKQYEMMIEEQRRNATNDNSADSGSKVA